MRIRRLRDGRVSAEFDEVERSMLTQLTSELVDLLTDATGASGETSDPSLPRDPAVERLLPDAYRGDADAAAEFRRFTETELVTAKTRNALALSRGASQTGGVELTEQEVAPWLRAITDLRLALATRLGIESDEDEGDDAPAAAPMKAAYWWLGELQERLIRALG